MNLGTSLIAAAVLASAGAGLWYGLHGQVSSPAVPSAAPPPAIPTFSTEDVASTGFFYAGGHYVGEPGKEVMEGAMYVEVMVPKAIRRANPIVFLHGAGQTGTDWLQTPDGRPGWAYFFLKQGYVVYMVDYPARGRSAWVPGYDGPLTIRTAPNLSQIWTAMDRLGDWPQAKKYTQWPGSGPNKGQMGDPVFDDFNKTQVQFLSGAGQGGGQDTLVRDAGAALLDRIGTPVILLTHSQGGAFGWLIADARPKLVRAIITAEPAGPPIQRVNNATQEYTGQPNLPWGVTGLPMTYDPPLSRSLRVASGTGGRRGRAGNRPLLAPAGDAAQAREPGEDSRAGCLRRSQLSSRLRRLRAEVAEPGRRQDRLREARRRGAVRQRPSDDDGEEQ